jgi:tRNA uridine 5-carbamoylmethylation protein Kti12
MSYLDHTFHMLLLLSIPLIYYIAHRNRAYMKKYEEDYVERIRSYDRPWATKSWDAPYGLLVMSLDHNDMPSLFNRSTFSSWQERFQDG